MYIKLIQPLMHRRPMDTDIKNRMSPPLGLYTIANMFRDKHRVSVENENVGKVNFDDSPDVVGISVNKPTMLADAPMLRTYINTYDSSDHTLDALVDALLTGPEAFKGSDPIDSYCGMYDTHM